MLKVIESRHDYDLITTTERPTHIYQSKRYKIIIIIKSFFNVGHIHLQNFHYIAEANKNQPWNIIDIVITVAFVHNT